MCVWWLKLIISQLQKFMKNYKFYYEIETSLWKLIFLTNVHRYIFIPYHHPYSVAISKVDKKLSSKEIKPRKLVCFKWKKGSPVWKFINHNDFVIFPLILFRRCFEEELRIKVSDNSATVAVSLTSTNLKSRQAKLYFVQLKKQNQQYKSLPTHIVTKQTQIPISATIIVARFNLSCHRMIM